MTPISTWLVLFGLAGTDLADLDPYPTLPPAAAQARLPAYEECVRQAKFYRAHRDWLRMQRTLHGHQDGRWDAWLAEAERHLTYWCLAEAVHEADAGSWWQRAKLGAVVELIGSARFWGEAAAWVPPRLVEPTPMPTPRVMPPADEQPQPSDNPR